VFETTTEKKTNFKTVKKCRVRKRFFEKTCLSLFTKAAFIKKKKKKKKYSNIVKYFLQC